ncbi:uncharacterized protein AKAW2_60484A [Aspergillus luchuensis]|uniref:Uncharacterized protein n=1 Tax=Aspergillus kawachii TaxID=1069201 RepID=A0A7R7WGF2_ASPKA|nr:uncharacterized protein AKAW2_60484A [Aspergillus luchuensis]BCS02220.1 hypothetical protein AKAW2_60484A [Aspergillus luchuensis]BCS13904.1 hypothetical protein ALUC_60460A [Aspergillus luchuensis]GAA90579.1 hypothetical protein AKAW_08693 [Aspergillus luchuensis IFO 4308]
MVLIAKLLTLALTAAGTPILRRDAITVDGLAGAVAIHDDLENLVSSVNDATTDTNSAGSLDDESGAAILADIQAVMGSLLGVLSAIENQATAWSSVPGGASLILGDLQSLNTAFDNFADALTTNGPASLSDEVTSFKTNLDNAFTSAEAAYSS